MYPNLLSPAAMLALPLVLLTVGCNRPQSGTAETGAQPAADGRPAPVELTTAGVPRRRDGYWEMVSYTSTGTPIRKQYLCVGSGSEDHFSLMTELAPVDDCSKRDFKRTASGWSFDMQCKLMDQTTAQKGSISGDFQNAFRVEQEVTQGSESLSGSIRGKWVGACPAKYKPGDLVDDDGQVLGNMLPH